MDIQYAPMMNGAVGSASMVETGTAGKAMLLYEATGRLSDGKPGVH